MYSLAPNRTEIYQKTTHKIVDCVGRTYKHGGRRVKRSIDKLKIINILKPVKLPVATPAVAPTPTAYSDIPLTPGTIGSEEILPPTLTEKRIWEREVDEYMKRKQIFDRNLENLYPFLWG